MDKYFKDNKLRNEKEKLMFRRTLMEPRIEHIEYIKYLIRNDFENLNIKEKEIILPRDYQEKIFKQIGDRNAIIYAETGRGKTYIAIMLMKQILEKEKNVTIPKSYIYRSQSQKPLSHIKINKDPKIIFIVPENSLLEQQSRSIEQNIKNFKIARILSGKTEKYTSSKRNFDLFLSQNDILVSTPEIIYRFLYSGLLNICDIRLLVFDECHHTDLNHAYNVIMSEFYFFNKINNPTMKLPQILGLTASPIKRNFECVNALKITEELEKLCENMDSILIMDPEIFEYKLEKGEDNLDMISPNEARREYIEINNFTKEDNYKRIINLLKLLFEKIIDQTSFDITFKKSYTNFIILRLNCQNFQDFSTIINENITLFRQSAEDNILEFAEKLLRQTFLLLEHTNIFCIFSLFVDFKSEITNNPNLRSTNIPSILDRIIEYLKKNPIKYESHRIILLKNEILSSFSEDSTSHLHRIIVFVDHRIVSKYLESEINNFLDENINCYDNNIKFKAVNIVGVSKNKKGLLNINNTQAEMVKKLEEFNKGNVQILIATSTLEEGIDIKDCDIVIVYTELKTVKSYIQMKGRARKKKAKFIMFSHNVEYTKNRIMNFIDIIKIIRSKFIGQTFVVDLRRKNFINSKVKEENYLELPNSKAKITLRNAAQIYNHLKNLLNNKGINIKPEINFVKNGLDHMPNFICTLTNIHPYFIIESNCYNKKEQSLSDCYIQFVELLLNLAVIDEYFNIVSVDFFK